MFIVTLPKAAANNPSAFAKKARNAGANILEIRGDLTPNVKKFSSVLPLLISPRGTGTKLLRVFQPTYLDLEVHELAKVSVPKGAKLILSVHEYKKTPGLSDLQKIVQKMCSLKPWMIKVATTVNSYKDLKALIDLKCELQKEKIGSTVMGMGPKAHLTRLLSPFSQRFTYASLDGFESSASGQLPLSLYSLVTPAINLMKKEQRPPKMYGIFGGPHITASLSPMVHNALFKKYKINAIYSCFPSENFSDAQFILSTLNSSGLSVTAPFKKDAFMHSVLRDPLAMKLGVANTIVKTHAGLAAFNTDVAGMAHGYPFLKRCKRIAILGAGGAVPSAIEAIRLVNPGSQITVFARDPKKAARLHVTVRPLREVSSYESDAVICAISDDILLPLSKMKKKSPAIDLRYRKTKFLVSAQKKGFTVYDGSAMLIHQALKQFEHFTGKRTSSSDASFLKKILSPYLYGF